MPYQDPKTKLWVGRVRVTGQQARVQKGFKNRTIAKRWELNEKENLKRAENQDYLFSQVADNWLIACKQRNREQTCNDKSYIINQFFAFLGNDNVLIKSITPLQVETFLNGIPGNIVEGSKTKMISGKTANRYRRELGTFFRYANRMGIVPDNPVKAIERYKETLYKRYVPPAEDIKAVMAVANGFEKNILTFAYHTLARAGEIRDCRWDDIDLEKETITLWTSKTRDGNPADDTIEMTKALKDLLASMPKTKEYVFEYKGAKMQKHVPFDMMARLTKKAGVKHFSLHAIRHHVAALLAYKLSLMEISKILRHRNLTTTDIYLRSLVKIETKGIKVLDDLNQELPDNVVPFFNAAKG